MSDDTRDPHRAPPEVPLYEQRGGTLDEIVVDDFDMSRPPDASEDDGRGDQ